MTTTYSMTTDPMGKLDLLSTVLEKATTRRTFLSDPWKTLNEAGIERSPDAQEFNALVETLAGMSFEELTLIGRFGEGIHSVLGPARMLF